MIAFLCCRYVLSLGSTYLCVTNGIDTTELLRNVGLEDKVEMIPEGAGDLAAAWAVCALTGPARGVLTIAAAPAIANWRQRNNNATPKEEGRDTQ